VITKLIEFSIRSRTLIFILTAVLFIAGARSAFKVKRDILPDLAIPIITLVIENHTLGPEDMETLIARPLEAALRTAAGVNKVTSVCGPGLLALSVEFEWDSDTWRVRQSISEKIASVQSVFPMGTEVSSIGTASSRMTEIFEFYISGDTDEMILREIADFMLKPKLQAARGVARVRTFGGDVRQYQILVDANKLINFGISFDQLEKAIEENNHNFTGGIFAAHGIEYIIRGMGAIKNSRELENVIIASSGGVPVYLSSVARVEEGPALKRGLMEVNGRRVVSLTVSKQPEVDTILAVESVKTAIAEITPFLPAGIKLETFFDQSNLINETSKNLAEAMLIGGAAVIIVLFLFMNNFLATFATAITIPLSVAAVFYLMRIFGLSANVMSLGGLVVGLGILIDASIVICENIFRHAEAGKDDNYNSVVKGAAEVFKPVLTSTLIICVVFIPLVTLSGFEGRVFYPFAFTMIASIFTGLILSFLLVPPLIFSLLSKRPEEKSVKKNYTAEAFLKFYKPLQRRIIAGGRVFSAAVFALFALSVIMLFNLPVELLPSIDENAIMISVVTPPGSSLAETGRLTKIACDRLKDAPNVEAVLQRSGRAEGSDCIEGVNVSEPYIKLVARNKRTHTIEQLFNIMNERVRDIPGILVIFTQPLANRIEETLSGTSAKFSIKLFGYDLRVLSEKGNELLELISTVPGLTNLQLEQTQGVPTILIKPDRIKAAKYGLNIEDIARTVEMAIEGKTVSKVLNNGREYDIVVRLDERFRKKISDIGELYIDTPSFGKVKLGEVSAITSIKGPGSIKRENMQRRIQINGSISGRDLFSIIEDIKSKLSGFTLADGYFISFGGNYEKQIKMLNEITYAFILALIGVFTILYASFGSAAQSLLIIATIPLALMGGVFALFITGMPLNISSLVGLIAHFGLSVQKGVILVEYINELRRRGHSLISSVIKAGTARLRPVMMTTLTTVFAVIPIAAGFGAGAEMQQPLAIVLIGGLVTSTIFTLLLLPLFYGFTEKISANL
jgi:cobalt-zinc-cadmium resistance protein CzcA